MDPTEKTATDTQPETMASPETTPEVSEKTPVDTQEPDSAKPTFEKGPRFWAIMATLCVIGLLSSLENTVVATSLPSIVEQLDMGEEYIWVTNVFFLTAAIVQPLFAQLANIFGRRSVTLTVVALFVLGSGIAGGADSGAVLILGRAIQGTGSGGINMIVEIVISDLVPLRERGNYIAIILAVWFVGMAVGPYLGGAIVENTTWRWVFWINLPIGGATLVMIFLFLKVRHVKGESISDRLRRIDYIGNVILVASIVSMLWALTYGGALIPWSSWRVILPLVLGFVGLGLFMFFETLPFVREPMVPPRLFANRTSTVIFIITFFNSLLTYWMIFFLPVYFQGVLGASPSMAGVMVLPAVVSSIPAAMASALLLAKFGKYKPLHLLGFATQTIGLGLMSMLDKDSSVAEWVIYQLIVCGGTGFVLNTLLPAAQAQVPESDMAAMTAAWSFVRSVGSVWGVAIPAAIFNNRFDQLGHRISDPAVAEVFTSGDAYQYANAAFIESFPQRTQEEIIGVFSDSLQFVWQVSIVFSGVCFFLLFLEKQVKLRTELETEFGLEKTEEANGLSEEKGVETTR